MAGLIGMIVGSLIGIWLLSMLLHWAVAKRFVEDPVQAATASVVMAWFVAGVLYGISNADRYYGGPINGMIWGLIRYALPAAIVGVFTHQRALKRRDEEEAGDVDELGETFE